MDKQNQPAWVIKVAAVVAVIIVGAFVVALVAGLVALLRWLF